MRHLWWTKCHWDSFSLSLRFSPANIIPSMLYAHLHSIRAHQHAAHRSPNSFSNTILPTQYNRSTERKTTTILAEEICANYNSSPLRQHKVTQSFFVFQSSNAHNTVTQPYLYRNILSANNGCLLNSIPPPPSASLPIYVYTSAALM